MEEKKLIMGQKELREKVLSTDLCTNCGACVNICPYFAAYKDRTIIMDQCDREEGRCFAFCPRTFTDLEALRQLLFGPADLTPELGSLKGFYMTRSADDGDLHGACLAFVVEGLGYELNPVIPRKGNWIRFLRPW